MSRLLSLARPDGALVYAATKSVDLLENRCEWAHVLPLYWRPCWVTSHEARVAPRPAIRNPGALSPGRSARRRLPPEDRCAWRAASLAPSRPWASPVARALVGVTARATPPASTIARALEANNTVFLILRGRFFGGAGEEISRSPATQRKHHNRTRASTPPPPGLASINFGELRYGEVRRKHFLERWVKREESTVASRRASKGLQPHCPSCYD